MKRLTALNNLTVADLKAAGWEEYRTAWTRGYVSRRSEAGTRPVMLSGRGEVYYLSPSWQSSMFCHRVYMRPATR